MPRLGPLCLLLAALAAANIQGAAAGPEAPSPQDLQGAFDPETGTVALSWTMPYGGPMEYRVYRDSTFVGTTDAKGFVDSELPMEGGWIYIVTAARPGQSWSPPAVTPVPGTSCEVVNLSTSWEYPYLYARLHEECLGGITLEKDVTWVANN